MTTVPLAPHPRLPRGALRRALLDHAVDLIAEEGPEAMSLREVQRRAGVSPAAAYRHYRDRDALLLAVGRRAAALLADHLQTAVENAGTSREAADSGSGDSNTAASALTRLRRGCLAYVDFAQRQPNLFRTMFLTQETPQQLQNPEQASVGQAGRGAFQILQDCVADLAAIGTSTEVNRPWTDISIWCATHGLAVLMLDGPLQHLDAGQRAAAADRLLDLLLDSLDPSSPPGPDRD